MNLERILQHKAILVWALRIGAKTVERVKKGEQDAELPVDNSDRRLAVIEELLGELDMQGGPGLEGTPMGDMVARQVYKAEDGTPLDVESLDEMLRDIGVDAPPGAMGDWTLDQRREVYAYVGFVRQALLNGANDGVILAPEFIERGWFTAQTSDDLRAEMLERPLEDHEIDAALSKGPWSVYSPGGPSDDWTVRKYAATVSDGDREADVVIEHGKFGQLDRARLIAANLNLIELGLAKCAEAQANLREDVAGLMAETELSTDGVHAPL